MRNTLLTLFALMLTLGSAAQSATVSDEVMIEPGKSLGIITLGMSESRVEETLGEPTRAARGHWLEYGKKDDLVDIFFDHDQVYEIRFNAKKYMTADGLGLGNCTQPRWRDRFSYARLQTSFMNTRQILKPGGLAFYRLNLDGTAGHSLQSVGLIFRGQPQHQAVMYDSEPDGGWEAWDGKPASLWEKMQHQNPGGLNPMQVPD